MSNIEEYQKMKDEHGFSSRYVTAMKNIDSAKSVMDDSKRNKDIKFVEISAVMKHAYPLIYKKIIETKTINVHAYDIFWKEYKKHYLPDTICIKEFQMIAKEFGIYRWDGYIHFIYWAIFISTVVGLGYLLYGFNTDATNMPHMKLLLSFGYFGLESILFGLGIYIPCAFFKLFERLIIKKD